jgi:DNA-directed RNA polymerase subunit beta'
MGKKAARRADRPRATASAAQKATVLLADRLRTTGYTYATKRRHLDLHRRHGHPAERRSLLDEAQKEVAGQIEEQYPKVSSPTASATTRSSTSGPGRRGRSPRDDGGHLDRGRSRTRTGKADDRAPSFNPIFIMADSGARGSRSRSASSPACAA